MNKFPEVADYRFEELVGHIEKLVPSRYLKIANEILNHGCYKAQNIDIYRLSGQSLNMESCYINLELIQLSSENDGNDQFSKMNCLPQSSVGHLRLEVPGKLKKLELSTLFDPRKDKINATTTPRRILIRGRAGVGKSTLCKKIVYEFTKANLWGENFDLILWIPLRHIRRLKTGNQNMEGLLEQEFFRSKGGKEFATGLLQQLQYEDFNRTLFLLDGLDEVHFAMDKEDDRYELLQSLLSKPNLIITSRPYFLGQQSQIPIDMETEVTGFSLDQVNRYIQNSGCSNPSEIQEFLQRNERVQSLVRIPIQLDALCYTWGEARTKYRQRSPRTMTELYSTIEIKLWQKDLPRRGLLSVSDGQKMSDLQIRDITKHDSEFLEILAFSGLCLGEVNFNKDFFDIVIENFKNEYPSRLSTEPIATRLQGLSFLRSSDTGGEWDTVDDNYHFLHLTFQEYFAARYFKRQWLTKGTVVCLFLDRNANVQKRDAKPQQFLHEKQYSPEFDVFWRFVCGLLQRTNSMSDDPQIDFFLELDCTSRDLLGPTHQRLAMHCLAEVSQSDELRTRLEDGLSQWLRIECSYRDTSLFVNEMEFPERALHFVLEQASESVKTTVLWSLCKRQNISLKTIGLVTGWLERGEHAQELLFAALEMLKHSHQSLPRRTLDVVMMRIDGDDKDMSDCSGRVLQSQKTWPAHVLEVVMTRLESPDTGIRMRTAKWLPKRSTLPEEILQTLNRWLKDEDGFMLREAFSALEFQTGLPDNILQTISLLLDEGNEYNKRKALTLLRHQSDLSEHIIQRMAAQFVNQKQSLRMAILEALPDRTMLPEDTLENISTWLMDHIEQRKDNRDLRHQLSDDVLQAVKLHLNHEDGNIRLKAIRVLQSEYEDDFFTSSSDDIFRVISTLLEDQDRGIRQEALRVLSFNFELPEDIIKAVLAQLGEQHQQLRETATYVLRDQATFSAHTFQVILPWLADQDKYMNLMALKVLSRKPKLPGDVLQAVAEQLEDEDGAIREAALETLGCAGSGGAFPDNILRAVAAQLDHEDRAVGKVAFAALGTLGCKQSLPENVLNDIAARIGDRDRWDRRAALAALKSQSALPEVAWQAVATLIEDADMGVGPAAVYVLENKQTWPEYVLAAAVARLDDADVLVRRAVAHVLARKTELSDNNLLAIKQRLGDEDAHVKKNAIRVLGSQTSLSDDSLRALVANFAKQNSVGKLEVMKILQRKPASAKMFLGDVVQWLENGESKIRLGAMRLLRTIATLTAEVLHVVAERLGDENDRGRWAAMDVLRGQETLAEAVLTSAALYPTWLTMCFEGYVHCYIRDGVCYLEFRGRAGKVRVEGDPDRIQDALDKRRRELDVH